MPRITRSTCAAIVSSLPSPFWTVATQPSANACAVAAIAASVCIAFVATMPKSHGGIAAASLVARGRPDDVSGAGEPQAAAVDRGDVQLVEVERPDLDVVEQRQVRREQRPDRPATHDRNPHSE